MNIFQFSAQIVALFGTTYNKDDVENRKKKMIEIIKEASKYRLDYLEKNPSEVKVIKGFLSEEGEDGN